MELEKKYERLRRMHKDQLVTNSLQSKRIAELKSGALEKDARIHQLELEIKDKDLKLAKSIEERSNLNDRVIQQSNTIADLREYIAMRIGIAELDAFDRRISLSDIANEGDEDETIDEQSDPLLEIEYRRYELPGDGCYGSPGDGYHESPENRRFGLPGVEHDEALQVNNIPLSPSPRNEQPYVETVRKRAERAQLTGTACEQCASFYRVAGPLPGPDGKMITPEERIQMCSRHRSRFERPKTPPGFWELDFISSQEFEEQSTRQKRKK